MVFLEAPVADGGVWRVFDFVQVAHRQQTALVEILDVCAGLFQDLVCDNPIFEERTRSIGIIPADIGAAYGVSGSNLRASGVDWDLRRDGRPYGLVYDELDWKVWTHPDGDS